MPDTNNILTQKWENGWVVVTYNEVQISLTKKDIVGILLASGDDERIITELQEKKLMNKKEQYKSLQPKWFENASEIAKRYRKVLEYKNNIKQMKYLQSIVSYNENGTMNILPLNKTFCKDIGGKNQTFSHPAAQNLEKENTEGYNLMTDYNETDTKEEREQTDWYKVVNVFSENQWDTIDAMYILRDMAWCNNRYWTATYYKNEKWEVVWGLARLRRLRKSHVSRTWSNTYSTFLVCGFKDMAVA